MSLLSKLFNAVAPALKAALQNKQRSRPDAKRPPAAARPKEPEPARPAPAGATTVDSPGRLGSNRTVEVDPHDVGPVRMSYNPEQDGDPDPGEVVWTWVPFEENNGQGKDRPVLVVAAEPTGTVLTLQLTSKHHEGENEFMPVGSGDWDSEHRNSWVNLERVLRVSPNGMRREASSLGRDQFEKVAARLRERYNWS